MARKISAAKTKTTTAKETLLTIPVKNTGLWGLAYVNSIDGTNSPTIYWYDASENVEYTVFGGKNLGAGDYIMLNDAEVALQEGDEIRIAQSGTSTMTFIVTVELVAAQAVQYHQ